MEIWLNCWNCEHETIQERKHYERFYRVQEFFSKEPNGTVKDKVYAGLIASHAFYICKKCEAPNYYVHEYWPTEGEPEAGAQESVEFQKSIRERGVWDKQKLFRVYHFPTFHHNPMPEWTKELPEDLMRLFWETYAARKNSLTTLCAMGIRAVIDVFAVAKVGDIGGFSKKLNKLKTEGHLSESQFSTLATVIEVGNAAAHRGYFPTPEQIDACLAVLEAIFFFEIQNKELEILKGSIPGRGAKLTNKGSG